MLVRVKVKLRHHRKKPRYQLLPSFLLKYKLNKIYNADNFGWFYRVLLKSFHLKSSFGTSQCNWKKIANACHWYGQIIRMFQTYKALALLVSQSDEGLDG